MLASYRHLRLLLLAVAPLLATAGPGQEAQRLPPAGEIIQKALARAKWVEEQEFEKQLSCELVSLKEHLNSSGEVKWREELVYKVYPINGHPYYELVEKNDEPLSGKDLEKEQDRRRQFREAIARGNSKIRQQKKDDTEIKFNEELTNRYRSEVLGRHRVEGRSAFVLRFEPKSKKLPVRRRIDHALNKCRGRIWIDEETFAVIRLEFHLMQPVKFWGGILGSITKLDGRLELERLEPGVWFFKHVDLYMDGRILFKSLHQRRTLDWSGYRMIAADGAEN